MKGPMRPQPRTGACLRPARSDYRYLPLLASFHPLFAVLLFAVLHMHYKLHRAMPGAANVSAFSVKVAHFVGGDSHLARMALSRRDVHMQVWNQETMCNIVRSDY